MQPLVPRPSIYKSTATYLDWKQSRYKQAKPYDLPTSYSRRVIKIKKRTGPRYAEWTADTNAHDEADWPMYDETSFAYNKAYDRFVNKVGSQAASLGALFTAERREAFNMVTDLTQRALQSGLAAKRGDYLGVLRILKMSPPTVKVTRTIPARKRAARRKRVTQTYFKMPDKRLVAKNAGSSWLLWSYGISPLLGDIDTSTEVFIRGLPVSTFVRSRADQPFSTVYKRDNSLEYSRVSYVGFVRSRINAEVTVSNPDLWLLNQLGLINPLSWANEAVPFSFVIDWASNWSSVINSLTDFVGLTLKNSTVSYEYEAKDVRTYIARYVDPHETSVLERDFYLYTRSVAPVGPPTLRFRYERFEWQRALNAISLLVGFLPHKLNNRS